MRENIHFKIRGAYQYDAVHNGICFQRSWHLLKYKKALELLDVGGQDVILDAACGSGVLTEMIAQKEPAAITGVDFSEAAIAFCDQQYKHERLNFINLDLQKRYFKPMSFTKIIMLEVIEHLAEDAAMPILKNLHDYLKPGGKLVVSTPNKKSLWPMIEWCLDAFRLTPKMKNEQHVKLYTKQSLRETLNEAGFNVRLLETSHFVAPWLSFLGQRTAEKVYTAEQKMRSLPGSLIFAVAEKI